MDIATVGQSALSIAMMVITLIIVGGATIAIAFVVMKWRKYNQFKCTIFEKDGFGQWVERTDDAGIFVHAKTKNKRFFMKKANVGLNPDNVPYIASGNKKHVYLLRTGLKNFHFINVRIAEPKLTLSVGEEDVNWAINAYEKQKKLFSQSMLLQLMPYIALAFVSITILIIFIYFFKDFDVLKDVAIALREAANAIAQAKTGTTVIN